jgi:integral membrane protein
MKVHPMWRDPVGRVRGVGMVEGTSALLLFFGAMPLKYVPALQQLSGQPELGVKAVFWVGLVHGLLFITYAAVAFYANARGYLPRKLLGYAAVASIVPFGPFVIDRRLKKVENHQPDVADVGELK